MGGRCEIPKVSPSTTGRCSRHAAAVLSNMGVGSNGRTARGHGSKSHRLIPPSHYSMGCYVYGWVVGYEQGNATCNSIWWDAL